LSLRRCWWLALSLFIAAWAGCQQGEMRLGSVRQLDCSGCLEALPINGWCSSCEHGLVAGLVIPSLEFHQLLDAHGHDVEIDTLQCGMCRIVAPQDEFCTRCRNGFVAGQLYFSELTWSLALGVHDGSGGDCPGCKLVVGEVGKCQSCGRPWVGCVGFDSKEAASRAAQQYGRLVEALTRLECCEECAIAGFFGSRCRTCHRDPIPDPFN
jgi:hypothetical protein